MIFTVKILFTIVLRPRSWQFCALRQKVEQDAASPAILVTKAGGYTLVP
jgi:hypothetical protein